MVTKLNVKQAIFAMFTEDKVDESNVLSDSYLMVTVVLGVSLLIPFSDRRLTVGNGKYVVCV